MKAKRYRINFSALQELPTDEFVGICPSTGEIVEGPLLTVMAFIGKNLVYRPENGWKIYRRADANDWWL